jgi:hypothetical protein
LAWTSAWIAAFAGKLGVERMRATVIARANSCRPVFARLWRLMTVDGAIFAVAEKVSSTCEIDAASE